MTVAELIVILNAMPPEAVAYVYDGSGQPMPVVQVEFSSSQDQKGTLSDELMINGPIAFIAS